MSSRSAFSSQRSGRSPTAGRSPSGHRASSTTARGVRSTSNSVRASSSTARSVSNSTRPRATASTNVADLFHAKYGRMDTEAELERRIIKQLESELIKVRKQHEKSMGEAANLQRLLDERGREHDKVSRKFHNLRTQLDDLNRQVAATKDEKVQVGMLVERQKEQTFAASGNLSRYHLAVKDLHKKVTELTEQKTNAEAANAALRAEIKKLNQEAATLEQGNLALQKQMDKLNELMYLKFD